MVYDRHHIESNGDFMDSKQLEIFKDLFQKFDAYEYNKIFNNVYVLNVVLYDKDKYTDKLVVVYKQNSENKFSSYETNLYSVTDAYKKVFEKALSSYVEFIEHEELSKYESIDDYFRVRKMEYNQQQTSRDETISKYKKRYEREAASPENLYKIIRNQQKQIDKLSNQLKKKKKLWFR